MTFQQLNKYILILLITILVSPFGNAVTQDQHIKVALRRIGHEFLLQMNDSTSRILPIKKIDGRYKLKFENEFDFEPSMLTFAIYKVIDETKVLENYIVEVEECGMSDVVHSFEVSSEKNDSMTACKMRPLPKTCYVIYFTIIEFAEQNSSLVKKGNYSIPLLLLLVFVLIVGVTYFKKKKTKQKINPNIISIGNYLFDKKGMLLILKKQKIKLSSKEVDLLFLLYSNENKTLEREYILNIVWGDEGDYIGRTLDVYISKLRKKLEDDPMIKIVNIRGIGYRFVIN